MRGPHVEHGLRVRLGPPHAAAFHAVLHQVAAGPFDDPVAIGQPAARYSSYRIRWACVVKSPQTVSTSFRPVPGSRRRVANRADHRLHPKRCNLFGPTVRF